MRSRARLPGAGTLLVVLAAALPRLPTLAEPLAMDQALFAVIGEGLLRGERLYVDLWDHKPPAIYLLYAGVVAAAGPAPWAVAGATPWAAVGSAPWAVALAGLAAAAATALLLRSLVAIRCGEGVGLLAGALYGLLANPILLGGFYATAQAEVFMETLVVAALFASAGGGRAPGLGAGLALGAAALFKPTALLFAPLLLVGWGRAEGGGAARPLVRGGPALRRFALGLAAPALLALAYVAASGALGAASDALVTWNLGAARAAAAGREGLRGISLTPPGVLGALFDGIILLGPFLVAAVAGAALSRARALPLAWLAAAIVSVLVQGKFYRYQYQPLFAPLVWLSALGLAEAAAVVARRAPRARRAARPLVALLTLVSLLPYAATVRVYWAGHRYRFPFPVGPAREEMLETYAWSDPPMRFADAARVAARIRAESAPDDRIAVLGFDPQVYLLADRAPAVRYLAHDHLRAPGAPSRLASDLSRLRPRWVVVATDQVATSDVPEAAAWIAENTEPRGTIGRFALFERTR